MKEVNGKDKLITNSLTKHLILNNRNTFGQKTIANSFNEYLNRKNYLRCILKSLTALLIR